MSSNTSYGKLDCKRATFNKGKMVPGKNPAIWRMDAYGNIIQFSQHGKKHKYGWDIDHSVPKAKGGADDIFNLRPLHSNKNRSIGQSMRDKDKSIYFEAIREKRGIIDSNKSTHFKFVIGATCIVKQTPQQPGDFATIISLSKKVRVRWISYDYEEDIEMDNRLFSDIPQKRTRR